MRRGQDGVISLTTVLITALIISVAAFGILNMAVASRRRSAVLFRQRLMARYAAEAGLVTDIARFKDYRDKRNITSHTYNQAKAEKIEAILPDFRDDMRSLLAELEKRNR